MNHPTGTIPATNNAPGHGVPAARPWLSGSCLANGVITMPPTTKNMVVASEIVLSGHSRSSLNASSYTASP